MKIIKLPLLPQITVLLISAAFVDSALAAKGWGVTGEEIARFDAKVVDILCELSGDCPENCGGGKRQLGLIDSEGKLILVGKNKSPFSGAAVELLPFCGKQVTADGLFTENRGVRLFALQFVREGSDGKWRGATRFVNDWAERNGFAADSAEAKQWFRNDPNVIRIIERDGLLGLGKEADKEFLAGMGMAASAQTASAPNGQALFGQRLCSTCHGPEGKAPIQSTYPKLAGQNKEYLVQQITDIQSGARNNGLTAVMKPIVQKVTAEEIEAISEYLSSVPR